MRKTFNLTFIGLQVPLDFVALMVAALTAYTLRFSDAFIEIRPILTEIPFSKFVTTSLIFSGVFVAIFAIAGLYSTRQRRAWEETGRVIVSCTAGTMILIATVFFQREFTTSRFIILAIWALSIFFVFFDRLLLRVIRHALLRSKVGHRRIVIIGKGKAAIELAELFASHPVLGYTVVKRIPTWNDAARIDLEKLLKDQSIEEVLLADPAIAKEDALELIAITESRNVTFKYLADLFAASFTNISVTTNGGIPIIEVKHTPLDGWGRIFKRFFDILISLTFIVLLSPVYILIAIFIKLTSKGPVFYAKQGDEGAPTQRIGENGKPFTYFKFRSMYVGADKLHLDPEFIKKHESVREGPLMKIKDDPRVTPFGKFLRATSLDEIPEFFLVLKGDMSLVGPRPHMPAEVKLYKPHHRRVLSIKPGITGMAQISGRANLDFEDEVRIDTWYIEHWSPGLDLWILLKTPFIVISRKGAY
ncbi:MAG: sugar transferase [Candidatus Uhrbacteria bacterium]|nr:sugar transferase [Candidatus Uhrbacteria bacterium]